MPTNHYSLQPGRDFHDAFQSLRLMDISVRARQAPAVVGYLIVLLFLAQVINYVDRMALAILLPAIKSDFRLSDTQLGLLTGFAFSIFYAFVGIPLARLADRSNRRNLLAFAVLAWSVMTAATGVAQNFGQLLVTRIGIGIGESGCVPPSHSMIVDLVSRSRRAVTFGFYTAAWPLGAMLGLALGGWLGALIGWRATFQVFGAVGVVLAILILFTTREPQRTVAARQAMALRESFSTSLKLLMRRRSYAFTMIGIGFSGFALGGMLQWLPSYYIRTFDRGAGHVGTYFGLAYGLGATTGILAGGLLGDRLAAKDVRWPLWLSVGAYVLSLPCVLGALYTTNFPFAMALIFMSFVILAACNAPVYAMIQAVSPSHLRALAVALSLFASSCLGAGLGPLLVGYTSDLALAHAVHNPLRIGLLTGIAFFPLPALCYALGARHVKEDLDAALAEERLAMIEDVGRA
jgi:MFS transporter, Spinster family, sphingosine-1-phosphate transporter